jgi:hypothetical protein
MRVLMWEARGDADGLIAWWRGQVEPGLPEGAETELFRSADRVVALVRGLGPGTRAGVGAGVGFRVPDPPDELVARPPHAWPFETVD